MRTWNSLERILAVERIIQSAPCNGITTMQIIEKLDSLYGIVAERKSIYNAIAELTKFMPINRKKVKYDTYWYLENETVPIREYQKEISNLKADLKAYRLIIDDQRKEIQDIRTIYRAQLKTAEAEVVRYKKIEATINEFWGGLQKLAMFKDKNTPTLEELLEYIENRESEAVKKFAEGLNTEILRVIGDIVQERNERLDQIESSDIVIPFDSVLHGYNSKLEAYDHINGFIDLQYKKMVGEQK